MKKFTLMLLVLFCSLLLKAKYPITTEQYISGTHVDFKFSIVPQDSATFYQFVIQYGDYYIEQSPVSPANSFTFHHDYDSYRDYSAQVFVFVYKDSSDIYRYMYADTLIFSLTKPTAIEEINDNTAIYNYNQRLFVKSDASIKAINVYNMLGQQVRTYNNSDNINMDLMSGMYIVQVQTTNQTISKKIFLN